MRRGFSSTQLQQSALPPAASAQEVAVQSWDHAVLMGPTHLTLRPWLSSSILPPHQEGQNRAGETVPNPRGAK